MCVCVRVFNILRSAYKPTVRVHHRIILIHDITNGKFLSLIVYGISFKFSPSTSIQMNSTKTRAEWFRTIRKFINEETKRKHSTDKKHLSEMCAPYPIKIYYASEIVRQIVGLCRSVRNDSVDCATSKQKDSASVFCGNKVTYSIRIDSTLFDLILPISILLLCEYSRTFAFDSESNL